MAGEDFQERTEKATRRRREKAREEGRVAKSQELNSAAMLCFGFLTLYMLGPHLSGQIMGLMSYTMANAPSIAAADPTFIRVFGDYMLRFFLIMAPILTVTVVIALAANVVQVGFKITPKAIEPKLEKLDIVKGLKRLFAVRSLVELVKNVIKLAIVGFVAYKSIAGEFE
ncbi:MAG: EscU/YscU/HrcU family type III secretion system export apparatus switch protein, partial [candidate division Zixibacteria bacterium]|nr:EscU/YscU/HrcU family type III secretion system export apparatus switch protein [candidate division Zixibacteria bacterium]